MKLPELAVRASDPDAAERAHLGGGDVGWQALAPALACMVLSTSVVTARWIARWKLAQCEGLDDFVILLSLLLSWAMTALIAAEVNGGRGLHAGPFELDTVAKLIVASNCLWVLTVHVTKASILIQYLRIFSSRCIRIICYIFLVLLIPTACWGIFCGIFLCTPTAKLWNPQLPGHCISGRIYWCSVAAMDIGLDFLILVLPLPAITSLRLQCKQRIGLLMVFTLGFLVCVFSVVRFLTVLLSLDREHYVESGVFAIVWSAVEANVGIICASLLSLKPLVAKFFPKMMEESRTPSHSMRIALIDSDGCCRKTGGKASLQSTTSPTIPSTSHSNRSSAFWRSSFTGAKSPQPLAKMTGINVVDPECSSEQQRGELSIFDMLQSRSGEVHAQSSHS